jgi:hypothetical protein
MNKKDKDMGVAVNISSEQFLDKIKRFQKDIFDEVELIQSMEDNDTEEKRERFRELLLSGPVMDDEQYQDYLERRNRYHI